MSEVFQQRIGFRRMCFPSCLLPSSRSLLHTDTTSFMRPLNERSHFFHLGEEAFS